MTVPAVRRDSTTKEDGTESQSECQRLPYPKSVFFIVVTEFCERFSYYGMRAVLTIYMRNVLDFSDNLSTTIYHVFLLLCYGLPVFGGILADSFIGKYKTIVYLSSIYALGNIVLTAASTKPLHLPVVALSLLGLAFMAIGTGGIKPCVVALGGEQFILPNQEKTLKQFFSVFLFAVSVGNMVATLITPVLRRDVSCFGDDTCYPLAFGVPGGLMIVAISVFIGGKCLYTIKTPEDNIMLRVVKCATYAITEKWKRKGEFAKKSHWLDYASNRYDEQLIGDSKGLFRVLVYYLPVPMFFALYEQLGSRWTLQATRMDGYIGRGFMIKPDQMQVANAILLFIFIPVFETVVYPVFHKCNLLKRPLQKMGVGGVLAALAFLSAAIVETKIESTYSVLHTNGESYLNFINTISCPVNILEEGQTTSLKNLNSHDLDLYEHLMVPANQNLIAQASPHNSLTLELEIGLNNSCVHSGKDTVMKSWKGQVHLLPFGGLQSIVISEFNGSIILDMLTSPEETGKSKEGNAKLRLLLSHFSPVSESSQTFSEDISMVIKLVNKAGREYPFQLNSTNHEASSLLSNIGSTRTSEFEPNSYQVMVCNTTKGNTSRRARDTDSCTTDPDWIILETGGSYVLTIHDDYNILGKFKVQLMTLTPPNHVHMLWLLPQYILIAWAEVLFIISGMEFSFTEAPLSMKSVVQSCWHLANACGNAIVIISAQFNLSEKYEFFGFSALMALDTLILCIMAIRYTYVDQGMRRKSSRISDTGIREEESKF